MCGIAGIVRLSGESLPPEARAAVKAMTDAMPWRGPDGEGQWLSGPVCLGHRRLSIIDIAGGSQPMASADGRFWIVFNGEIYNFRELRRQLKDAALRTQSDTEVILACYAAYGPDCLDMLEGMFAFALWDTKARQLFCARDHLGKKPFYYTQQAGYFAFASELGPLTRLAGCPFAQFDFRLSAHSLMRYLAYEYVPAPATIYAEAKALEPAHSLTVAAGHVAVKRYWDLPMPQARAELTEEEASSELGRRLRRAVSLRMISDVPLGVFLSGGIDSTIVAGLMAEQSQAPIQTFSIGFSEASYDESRYSRLAAKAFHTIHHERILSASACADELPKLARRMDTPMADASCAPTWLLSQLARENVTVALGGDGADEFWAGYEHYIGYNLALLYNRLPKWLGQKLLPKLASFLPE
ncbi:MAG: asparagine synthase (glutamine-hydrolyzing), partial [Desulfovibrio sp.]|nr:asparagine synthase (glutamine-hydrolyzing) [Desulfovibrio sp.]